MESQQLKNILEAALLAAGEPRNIDQLRTLFGEDNPPDKQEIRAALNELQGEYATRGIELREVASGYRVQIRESMSHWLARLWEERPPRYSRALMETLAIIAYRQPVTRGDVEEIRGVVVTSNIIRTLLERNWIKVVGHRDVPGKPAMFGTTREFLDYFGLQKLDDLPPLAELARLEPVSVQLDLGTADQESSDHVQLPDAIDGESQVEDMMLPSDSDPDIAEEHDWNASDTRSLVAGDDDDDDFDDDDYDDDEEDDEEDDFDDEDEDLDDDEDDDFDDDNEERNSVDDLTLDDSSAKANDDADSSTGTAPGIATPLVAQHPRGSALPQPGKIASLDAARVRRAEESPDDELDAEDGHAADAVPLQSK
jgi:segregation and condensation protein B